MSGRQRARRDYGTGSIYQRCEARYGCPPLETVTGEDGKPRKERPAHKCQARWYGQVDLGWDEQGNRNRPTVSAATEAQVKVRLRALLAKRGAGQAVTVSDRTTVKQIAEEWLPIAETALRPGPMRSTRGAVKNWIVPTIGHKRVSQLTPGDWRAINEKMRLAGRTGSTRRRTHSTLMSLLKFAQQEGHAVPANVLAVKAPLKGSSNDRINLPAEDAIAVLVAAAQRPDASRWATALLEAMRQGECLGLTWDCVDFDNDLIRVEWQLQPLPYRIKHDRTSGFVIPEGYRARQVYGRWHLVELKTDSGYRVLPMVPLVRKALLAWRDVAPKSKHGLVWPRPDGNPRDPRADDQAWRDLQDAAGSVRHATGRHFTIHEARHTTASLLLELETPPEIIIAIMGHASMLSTKAYLHVRTGQMAAALAKVEERLALPSPTDGQSSSAS